MDLGLKGKIAVITGASKGIGYAVAEMFLSEGANVFICARHKEELETALASLNKSVSAAGEGDSPRAEGLVADVTKKEDVCRLAEAAAKACGRIDCWVNNVGASFPREGQSYSTEELERVTKVCFFSAVYGTEAAFPYMKKQGGSIVNVSSLAARCPTVGASTLYGPLKAAVMRLAVSFAGEYGAWGIRVNAVLPGFTATPAVRATIDPAYLKRNADETLLRRVARPEEIAAPIVFLCSKQASYITGTSIEASGGRALVLNPEFSYVNQEKEGGNL